MSARENPAKHLNPNSVLLHLMPYVSVPNMFEMESKIRSTCLKYAPGVQRLGNHLLLCSELDHSLNATKKLFNSIRQAYQSVDTMRGANIPSEEIKSDLIVDRTRNALAISKANESTNKSSDPTLHAAGNANLAASPAYALVDEHKQAKISSVRNSLFNDEFDSFHKAKIDYGIENRLVFSINLLLSESNMEEGLKWTHADSR